ncbi:MAG: hypothetical protein ACRDFB_05020 [Rhabdochlamydiaceae bacterium]
MVCLGSMLKKPVKKFLVEKVLDEQNQCPNSKVRSGHGRFFQGKTIRAITA